MVEIPLQKKVTELKSWERELSGLKKVCLSFFPRIYRPYVENRLRVGDFNNVGVIIEGLRFLFVEILLCNLFGLGILLCLYIVRPFRFIKLCKIRSINIGQQAGNTGLFLRRLQLGKVRQNNRILYVGISGKPDNQQLLKMFERKLHIIQIQSEFLRNIHARSILSKSVFYEELPLPHNAYYEFNNTEPDLHFTSAEEEEGRKLLSKMGIDDKSWFVCFYSRDPAFQSRLPVQRQYPGDFRNSDIDNYLEAAKYIASCGGFAIRMGYIVAKKLPDLNNPRIIDYASNYRTDFGDIYLLAKCKFFIGDTAGLWVVATIFNVPVAGVNFIPFHTPFRKGDLVIPKKIRPNEGKRFLTLREYIEFADKSGNLDNFTFNEKLNAGKDVVIENTSGEILDLAKEMNERLDGTFETTGEDEELQARFRSLLQPPNYFAGTPARIGAKFLRENRELLE